MRAQMKTPARFGDRALGSLKTQEIMDVLYMSVRHRAVVRNHLELPLWRSAVAREQKRKASYAERKLRRRCPGLTQSQAALIADLIGYPREEG